MTFDACKFWKNKIYKKWIVYLTKPGRSGRKPTTYTYNVQARTPERAIVTAKTHCLLTGKLEAFVRLAEPEDICGRGR